MTTREMKEDTKMAMRLASNLKDVVESRRRTFIFNDEVKSQIEQVADWLITGDKPFLILCGSCGNGKTSMMRAIARTTGVMQLAITGRQQRVMLQEEQATEIARSIKYDYLGWKAMCTSPFLGIDDMGEEPAEVRSYGNYLRPITELLQYRYDKLLPTVITTNLTPRQITEKYGLRIAGRLTEVAKKIAFLNPSFRSVQAAENNPSSPAIENFVTTGSEGGSETGIDTPTDTSDDK
ncbi:MAG: hypothetical protein KHX42_04465 [Prevotella sp.]|nr:hypothetical protein [Prevotella sp.]